jgi:hypothetical protein
MKKPRFYFSDEPPRWNEIRSAFRFSGKRPVHIV